MSSGAASVAAIKVVAELDDTRSKMSGDFLLPPKRVFAVAVCVLETENPFTVVMAVNPKRAAATAATTENLDMFTILLLFFFARSQRTSLVIRLKHSVLLVTSMMLRVQTAE